MHRLIIIFLVALLATMTWMFLEFEIDLKWRRFDYISCMICRLILIAEKDTVYDKFPTPLINRLEKHFVLTESILEPWQEEVLEAFDVWIKKFSDTG